MSAKLYFVLAVSSNYFSTLEDLMVFLYSNNPPQSYPVSTNSSKPVSNRHFPNHFEFFSFLVFSTYSTIIFYNRPTHYHSLFLFLFFMARRRFSYYIPSGCELVEA